MNRGRPAAIRSTPLSGTGRPLSADQWSAVWELLRCHYTDPASSSFTRKREALPLHHSPGLEQREPVGMADIRRSLWSPSGDPVASEELDRIYARYQAQAEAEAKVVGVGAEQDDLRTIAKECRQLAAMLPVDAIEERHLRFATRLAARLTAFPPIAQSVLHGDGIDVWPQLEWLSRIVGRPDRWAETALLAANLIALADACERPIPQGNRTQPRRTARDAFVRGLRDLVAKTPPDMEDTQTGRDGLIRDLCEALDIPVPSNAFAAPRGRAR